jgi:hypothetical protein
MQLFKECLRMEAICRELARQEPHKREQWRAKAKMWHQRAGQMVTGTFGDVALPSSEEESSTGWHSS